MKNYASFINESFNLHDCVLFKSKKHKYLTGEVVLVDRGTPRLTYIIPEEKYSVRLDREIDGKLYYAVRSSDIEKITPRERKEYQERYLREKEQLNLINTDIDPYGEENWLGESTSDFSRIKDILPSTEMMDGDTVCDPDEFLRTDDTKFHYCYHPKGQLADLLNQLELFGAIDIKVGGLRFKDGKIYSDTLYFKNVRKDVFSEFGWDDPHGPWPEQIILLKQEVDGRSVEVNRVIDPYGEEDWLDDLPVKNEWKIKWEYDNVQENLILERLGISDVVYRTAEKIYNDNGLKKYEIKRDKINERIVIDTRELEPPFNEMNLAIYFDNRVRPKKVHGGVDRIEHGIYAIYIYSNCNNIARTLTHELDHVYQIFLRKKHYNTNKEQPSAFRKSEQSPTLMSVYIQLIQRGVKDKKDFIEKIQKLPKFKKYIKIAEDPKESVKNKRWANKMMRKMYKMWDLFQQEEKK